MAENTKESPQKENSLEVTRATPMEDIASAKILFQEGLFDEAKKLLFKILFHLPQYKPARQMLEQIQEKEEQALLSQSTTSRKTVSKEKPNPVVEDVLNQLDRDLSLGLHEVHPAEDKEIWVTDSKLSAYEHYDLGVAFFEMSCYRDAIRELKRAEKKIRQEETFLGPLGVAVVALCAECMLITGEGFQAKLDLDVVVQEPDLELAEKIPLFYIMGRIELELGHREPARAWLSKVIALEPDYRDVKVLLQKLK